MHTSPGVPTNWTRVTADQVISDRPVVLYGIQVYLSGQTGGTLIVRNGQTAHAPIVFTIDVNANTSKHISITHGVLLDAGLFLDLDAYITEATAFWLPFVQPVEPSVGHREVRDHAE